MGICLIVHLDMDTYAGTGIFDPACCAHKVHVLYIVARVTVDVPHLLLQVQAITFDVWQGQLSMQLVLLLRV